MTHLGSNWNTQSGKRLSFDIENNRTQKSVMSFHNTVFFMCVYFKYSSKIKKRSLRDPLPAAACGTPGWLKVGRGNKYCLHAQTHTHLYFSHVSLITNQL